MNQDGAGPLIEIDTRGFRDGPEVEFPAPGRMPGLDQVRYSIRPEHGPAWYLVLQAVSLEIGLSKNVTIRGRFHSVTCVSYGGNAVYGNTEKIETFQSADVGTCLFMEILKDTIVIVGDLSIARIDENGEIEYFYHEMGFSDDIKFENEDKIAFVDIVSRFGRKHIFDLKTGRRIREI